MSLREFHPDDSGLWPRNPRGKMSSKAIWSSFNFQSTQQVGEYFYEPTVSVEQRHLSYVAFLLSRYLKDMVGI